MIARKTRYYRNFVFVQNTTGESYMRLSRDGIAYEVTADTGIGYTYEADVVKKANSYVNIMLLPSKATRMPYIGHMPVRARVTGVYKTICKMNRRKSRRIVIKGRLLAIGSNIGIILRKDMVVQRNINKKYRIISYGRKRAIWNEIGKMYCVQRVGRSKNLMRYKLVS